MPQPKADQHLVRIVVAALNPVDYRLAEFQFLHRTTFPKPASPGSDFAGYIVKPAQGSALKPGQFVFGAAGTNFMCGGALSEYGIANTRATTPMPTGLSTSDAASITVAGLTAYQAILPHSKPGSRVFLNGGSGGVGAIGIQIAKVKGRHVTVTCSTANVELCKSLGADEVIDYKTQDVLQTLKASPYKYDLVVDNVGNDQNLYWKAHEYTNPGAKFITVAISHHFSFIRFVTMANLLPKFFGGGKRQHLIVIGEPKGQELEQIADWMVEGKIKAVIDSKYKFEEVREAYKRLKTGRAKGKIIVNVAPEEECTA
ncbi:putative zinc-type alcohol dehydrogenase-like protein C16A3.02c [Mollisia scopiformis]|uniref:Putative zinc-type alcohol dehydrogenase-like protein C16A3.02c n=1 Tax=Mollisia scopiformis TaxID=149040 RepID=A0A194XKB0_MOLSC|nr:putative zinc-type alcohol dehydrogenase-like protein C16A3.02c [Mollisia scopiformis]KUJ20227.1 putative zinc-type alcohol dehydrogenase-like protein C16A3.02c [Mollisia scopiformis]